MLCALEVENIDALHTLRRQLDRRNLGELNDEMQHAGICADSS